MSARPELVTITGERRDRARRKLGVPVTRRVPSAGLLALVDAAADALAEGRVGAAHDLLSAVCSPRHSERVLRAMLGDEPTASRRGGREMVA